MVSKASEDGGFSEREQRLSEVIQGFLEALDSEEAPDPQETIARHPELAPELEEFFADQDFVAHLISSRGGAHGGGGKVRVLSPPIHFSEYELLEEMDPGGMGVVYKARQDRLQRMVALKMIRSGHLASFVDRHRFQLEARAVASLDHPNIVPLHHVGEHEGRLFFTMKFLEGGSLAERIPRLLEDREAAVRLMQVVAVAVQYAHERGILHRDLKPANILLDLEGTPYVADFGLAKRLEADFTLTHTGTLVGTPAYMAPEQVRGKKGDVTTAVDVYSLGAILYECLTGQVPFRGSSIPETLEKVVNEEPVRPSQLCPGVPTDLETICLTCLEKDPGRRYGSASALAEDLQLFLEDKPIRARPSSRWKRVAKWCRRHPAAAGLVTVSCLALMALFVVSFWYNAQLKLAAEKATARELETRRLLYDARMILAYDAFYGANYVRTHELLEAQIPEEGQEDLRSFDWDYLWHSLHRDRLTLRGHDGMVHCLAFSPESKVLATAGQDQRVVLWDAETGERLSTLMEPGGYIFAVAISPDGSRLAVSALGRPISVWNLETEKREFVLEGHTGLVSSLAFAPDEALLVSGGNDATVRVWDLETRTLRWTLEGHEEDVHAVGVSPDNTLLASGGGGGSLRIWDRRTGSLLHAWRDHSGPLLCLAFSPDSRRIATAGWDATVKIRDTATGKVLATFLGHTDPVASLAFSPDGRWLATASNDHTVKILGADDVREVVTLAGHEDRVAGVAFSRDGDLLASCSHDGAAKIWSLTALDELRMHRPHSANVTMLALVDEARTLISGSDDLTLRLWKLASADGRVPVELLASWGVNVAGCSANALSPDGRFLAAAGEDLLIRVWRLERSPRNLVGREVARLSGHRDTLHDLAFSTDSGTLISAAEDSKVRLWRRVPGVQGGRWEIHADFDVGVSDVWDVELSPDGKTLALARKQEPLVLLWDVTAGRLRSILEGHRAWVVALAFSSDSRWLATGGLDWNARLWHLPAGEGSPTLRAVLDGHKNAVASLVFSPDGRIVASGSDDATVRLWSVSTGGERGKLERGHTGAVDRLVFSQDMGILISGGGVSNLERGEVRLWRGAPGPETQEHHMQTELSARP